jgi:uncharacterized repeat protein (TIGR04052 family)
MMYMHKRLLATALLTTQLTTSCGHDDHDHDHDHDHHHDATPTQTLRFALLSGDEAFACNKNFAGLGRANSTWSPRDAKLYIHDIALIDAQGDEHPFELIADGAWQTERVVLLDFEDGSGTCTNGNAPTNTIAKGRLRDGTWRALRFTVGVPFDMNHVELTSAPSPLNLTSMWWSWQGGYKFMRLDGQTDGMPNGVQLHLGSTGCEMSQENVVSSCAQPNRVEVRLDDFSSLKEQGVALDLKALMRDAHLDATEGGAQGCMSGQSDPDCAPIFANLGLSHGAQPAGQQSVFRVVPINKTPAPAGSSGPGQDKPDGHNHHNH